MSAFDIYSFAGDVLALSIAKGFDRPFWENMPGKLAFVFSEIDEAECVKWRGELAEELADIGMRVLAILVAHWGHEWSDRRPRDRLPAPSDTAFLPGNAATLLWPFIRRTNLALTAWRNNADADVRINLEYLMRDLFEFAAAMHIDLATAMQQKHEKNKERPHQHGHQQSAG